MVMPTATREATAASAETSARGAINLRIDPQVRQVIDEAATLVGKTRTEFMIDAARREAIDVLLDQRLFTLDSDKFDAFLNALDTPVAPGPRLRSLLARVPSWRGETAG